MRIEEFLCYLPNARAVGDSYRASCPTDFHKHGDRSRGLSIRPIDDRILVFCHAGCTASDICGVLGIGLKDLFFDTKRWSLPTVNYRERLELIAQELRVIAIGAEAIRNGELSDDDMDRYVAATHRLAGFARLGIGIE